MYVNVMVYTLMRHYFNASRDTYVLDLYDELNETGVELHYYLKGWHKFNINELKDKMQRLCDSHETHIIEWWDDMVRQYQKGGEQ